MSQQTLHTERLTLVPLADEHLEWEVEFDSDPEVMRFLSGGASTPKEVEAGHARRMAAAQKVDELGFWVSDGDIVGIYNQVEFERFEGEPPPIRAFDRPSFAAEQGARP